MQRFYVIAVVLTTLLMVAALSSNDTFAAPDDATHVVLPPLGPSPGVTELEDPIYPSRFSARAANVTHAGSNVFEATESALKMLWG